MMADELKRGLRAALAASQLRVAELAPFHTALATSEHRVAQLLPLATAHNNACRDALIILPQHDKSAFALDLRAIGSLCRATRAKES